MIEVREVLRAWLAGSGLRTAGERAGVDRKTARRCVEAGQAAGLVRDGGEGQLTDGLIGAVLAAVRTARASGHGVAWEELRPWTEQITVWLTAGLPLTNIHGKLTCRGVAANYGAYGDTSKTKQRRTGNRGSQPRPGLKSLPLVDGSRRGRGARHAASGFETSSGSCRQVPAGLRYSGRAEPPAERQVRKFLRLGRPGLAHLRLDKNFE